MVNRVKNRKRAAGFTLIELLVVMLIVALVASVVVLNMPPPGGNARSEADIFAARLNAAAELAIMTGSLIGLETREGGYAFYLYDRGEWSEAADRRLSSDTFSADIAVEFAVTELARKNEKTEQTPRDKEAPAPTVFFAPTGETTPFKAEFKSRRGVTTVTLDAAGNIGTARDE